MESPEYFQGSSYWGANAQLELQNKAGGGAGEQFAFEDLLDFSNEEDVEDLLDFSNEEDVEDEAVAVDRDDGTAENSTDSSTVTAVDSCSNSSSSLETYFPGDHSRRSFIDAGISDGFCDTQYEELAELEWLSNFVEESFSSEDHRNISLTSSIHSTNCRTAPAVRAEVSSEDSAGERSQHSSHLQPSAQFPGKARSKRSRAAPCSWSSRLLVLSSSHAATSSPESELIILPDDAAMISSGKTPANPTLKKRDASAEGRRCRHCQTDKTPQWRTGPMGPKTLCNACGVRYKSGRLVPEYRPAASPTFMVSKHSNSHRKVLELRRQKQLQQQHQQLIHVGGAATSLYDVSSPPMSSVADEFLIHGSHLQHLL